MVGMTMTSAVRDERLQATRTPPKLLRRHKTFQNLRPSAKPSSSLKSFKELHATADSLEPHHGQLNGRSSVGPLAPLASRTNRKQTLRSEKAQNQLPVRSATVKGASDRLAASGSSQPTKGPQLQDLGQPEAMNRNALKIARARRCKSFDDRLAKHEDICSVQIQNLNDSIGCPDDFFKPATRADPESVGDIRDPVQRIDVTTCWKELSSADAEDLFYIHTVFQDALQSILAKEVRDMFQTVQQDFELGKGKCTYLDGFKVAVEDRWVCVDREELVRVMSAKAFNFFSETQYQPGRSALMQLYLSSKDCFLDWAQNKMQEPPQRTGLALRTCYDQLSRFEAPTVTAGLYCDYVNFPNLNRTPREDEYMILTPQYNREGGFLQTPRPENVRYTMENPVQWLTWNDHIKGFVGRVPTYSAISGTYVLAKGLPAVSHVIDITIHAVFSKYCTTGAVYFERKVRTRLTLGVLPKTAWSAKNSVYGVEQRHSLSPSPTASISYKPLALPIDYSYFGNGQSQRSASSSNDANQASETSYGYTPHGMRDLTLPKRVQKPQPLPSTSVPSEDGPRGPDLHQTNGMTSFHAHHYLPSASATISKIHNFNRSGNLDCKELHIETGGNPEPEHGYEAIQPLASDFLNPAIDVPGAKQQCRTSHAHDEIQATPRRAKVFSLSHDSDVESWNRNDGILFPKFEERMPAENRSPVGGEPCDAATSTHPTSRLLNQTTSNTSLDGSYRRADCKDSLGTSSAGEMPMVTRLAIERRHTYLAEADRSKTKYMDSSSSRPPKNFRGDTSEGGRPTDNFETRVDNLDNDTDPGVYVMASCTMPHVIQPFAMISGPLSKPAMETNTLGKYTSMDNNVDHQRKGSSSGRLGLEEEIAFQKAIEESREEQLQRKMAAQGFQASFDDIFDDDLTEHGFDYDSANDDDADVTRA